MKREEQPASRRDDPEDFRENDPIDPLCAGDPVWELLRHGTEPRIDPRFCAEMRQRVAGEGQEEVSWYGRLIGRLIGRSSVAGLPRLAGWVAAVFLVAAVVIWGMREGESLEVKPVVVLEQDWKVEAYVADGWEQLDGLEGVDEAEILVSMLPWAWELEGEESWEGFWEIL